MDLFKTRDHVSNFDDYVAEYKVLSKNTRKRLQSSLDVAYGTGSNETMDLFFPSTFIKGSPIHLFIHGGYWRMFDKDDFSFIADNVTACGAIAAVMDYDLMPGVRMEKIVDQVRLAFNWLGEHAEGLGGDPKRLSVSGHSAGAHLATFTFSLENQIPPPKSALLLSGIYDLEPLQSSFLEPLIGITNEEVRKFSPLKLLHASAPRVEIAYGDLETEPFSTQAQDFSDHLGSRGSKATVTTLAGSNHMSVVQDLGNPTTVAGRLLQKAIKHT